ncbi:MAG: DoxX family protein [Bacteroidia bacterium]
MDTTIKKKSDLMNVSIWIAQGLLALLYLMAGANKSFESIEELSKMLPWVLNVAPELVRFIGVCELLGSIGLILPSVLRIKPILTPIAALGLGIIQILAAVFHSTNGEISVIGVNFVFLTISVFVAWGRYKKSPIISK